MNEYIGWYINNGVWSIKHLLGEGAICIKREGYFDLQFHNKELPMCYTHGWRKFFDTEVLLQLGIIEDYIYLAYCGKQYRRRIRNGKFQFHNLELVCLFTVDSEKRGS